MTPKEKALDLFDKFYLTNAEWIEIETGEVEWIFSLSEHDAKQCAILCAEQILCVLRQLEKTEYKMIKSENYWKEVKQEIQNL